MRRESRPLGLSVWGMIEHRRLKIQDAGPFFRLQAGAPLTNRITGTPQSQLATMWPMWKLWNEANSLLVILGTHWQLFCCKVADRSVGTAYYLGGNRTTTRLPLLLLVIAFPEGWANITT